jgi:hypothetical protein
MNTKTSKTRTPTATVRLRSKTKINANRPATQTAARVVCATGTIVSPTAFPYGGRENESATIVLLMTERKGITAGSTAATTAAAS